MKIWITFKCTSISEQDREEQYFEDIVKLEDCMPNFTVQVLQKYAALKENFFTKYPEVKTVISTYTKSDPRATRNYAIPATGFIVLADILKYNFDKDEFLSMVGKMANENKIQKDAETEVQVFWGIVESLLIEDKDLSINYHNDYYILSAGKIYIWFQGIYDKFVEKYIRLHKTLPFNKNAIKKYLQEESYFIEEKNKKINKLPKRCMVLDWEKFKAAGYDFFREPLVLPQEAEYKEVYNVNELFGDI